MEQNTNAGLLKLSQRILDEAGAEAEKILEDAKGRLKEQSALIEKQKNDIRAEFERKRTDAVAGILDGARTRATIDGSKNALRLRREKIDKAYERAFEAMRALPDADRAKVLKALLLRESEGGETVLPASQDRKILNEILSEIPEKRLTLSGEDAAFENGFMLRGDCFEKDCSFRALLGEIRAETETEVSKLLFD